MKRNQCRAEEIKLQPSGAPESRRCWTLWVSHSSDGTVGGPDGALAVLQYASVDIASLRINSLQRTKCSFTAEDLGSSPVDLWLEVGYMTQESQRGVSS
jgi:hypothetical protein